MRKLLTGCCINGVLIHEIKGSEVVKNKAYRFGISPNSIQKTMFAKTFGGVRFVYNKMFGDELECYKIHKKMLKNILAQYETEFA